MFSLSDKEKLYISIYTWENVSAFIRNSADYLYANNDCTEYVINKETGNVMELNLNKEDTDLPFEKFLKL